MSGGTRDKVIEAKTCEKKIRKRKVKRTIGNFMDEVKDLRHYLYKNIVIDLLNSES